MAQQQRGWLHLGDRAEHLDVSLTLNRGALAISTDGATWEWPVSAVDANFWDGAEFELDLDGETVIFYSEDPLGFLFDFLPALRSQRSRRPVSLRSWRRRSRPEDGAAAPEPEQHQVPAPARPDVPVAASADERWTDVALGRAYSDVMVVLEQLYGSDRDQRGNGHHAAGHAGCTECRGVLIDLADSGETP